MEYSPEFLALQQASVAKAEQQFGSTIIPAEVPDWSLVEREALALCERTCDLRVVALLTHAWTELRGVAGFAEGVELVASLLESAWNDAYPQLHLDGEYDPMPRVNALVALGEANGVGRALRDSRLLDDVHGQITLRNAEALLDGSATQVELYPGGRSRLQDSLKHAAMVGAQSVTAVPRALDALTRIKQLVAREAGSEWSPDFSSLERTLSLVVAVLQDMPAPVSAGEAETTAAAVVPTNGETETAVPESRASVLASWRDLSINSRDDALLALDKVCRYFDTHEPSHPAPMLIRRVQQTIPLDFHELLKNLAPQGVEQFTAWMPRSE